MAKELSEMTLEELWELFPIILKDRYEHNRDAYTDAKGEFVNKYSAIAKLQFAERYHMKR